MSDKPAQDQLDFVEVAGGDGKKLALCASA